MNIVKYSASGNDFIILIASEKINRSKLAKKLCHRQNGVGADGLIVVLPNKDYDFEWDFYNSDGSNANMCGNATRAVSHFAIEHKISINGKSTFLTKAGIIMASINGLYVEVNMPTPHILSKDIIEDGENWWLINSGVPHIVSIVKDINEFNILKLKKLREKYNANVNIAKVEENKIYIRTYERGVEGETLACGTGIIATSLRAYTENLSRKNIIAFPKNGDELYISLKNNIWTFAGKVNKIFKAEVFIDNF